MAPDDASITLLGPGVNDATPTKAIKPANVAGSILVFLFGDLVCAAPFLHLANLLLARVTDQCLVTTCYLPVAFQCCRGVARPSSFSMVVSLLDDGFGAASLIGSWKVVEVVIATATPSTFDTWTKVHLRQSSDLRRPRSLGSLLRRGSGGNHH